MSRRHHHTGREPRTEQLRLDRLGEALLDALEVETRAQQSYEIAEQAAVDELNRDPGYTPLGCPPVRPIPWAATDPETRRVYRRATVQRMHETGQLHSDQQPRDLRDTSTTLGQL